MIYKLIIDYFFAAIAGMGFGIVFNPPVKFLFISGIFAGLGHSLRLFLMGYYSINVFAATLAAAFVVGIFGFAAGRINGCPAEVLTFPAVLPMIPGIYAYETFLSGIKFLSENMNTETAEKHLTAVLSNGITASSIMVAIVLGASASVFIDTLSSNVKTRKLHLLQKLKINEYLNK